MSSFLGKRWCAFALGIAAASAATLAPITARAHGGGPFALDVEIDADGARMALTTTFGFFLSANGGQTWDFHCNESFGLHGPMSPLVQEDWFGLTLLHDGKVGLFSTQGVRSATPDECAWSDFRGVPPGHALLDAALVPGTDTTWITTYEPVSSTTSVSQSDAGSGFELSYTFPANFALLQIVPVRDNPELLYLAGYNIDSGGLALAASTDKGKSWTLSSPLAGVSTERVSFLGAAPDAGALLFRVASEPPLPDEIWRSSDGGITAKLVLRLAKSQNVTGFTFGETTNTLLVAGSAATGADVAYGSLYRSDDAGETFDTGIHEGPPYRCLAFGARRLYACADSYYRESFALGVSLDFGLSWQPVVNFAQSIHAADCASSKCQDTLLWVRNFYATGTDFDAGADPDPSPPARERTRVASEAGCTLACSPNSNGAALLCSLCSSLLLLRRRGRREPGVNFVTRPRAA